MRLALLHRTDSGPAPERSLTWKTCRREMHFLDEPIAALPSGALADAEAYQLLLEVVCGLHSPILGETEVQAQFKSFAAEAAASGRDDLARLCQWLLADAKTVRHEHLQGFGARSYGALAMAHFSGTHLVVVGTGALAAEVTGAAPPDVPVDVWGRRLPVGGAFDSPAVRFRLIGQDEWPMSAEPSTLVVAAPVSAPDLEMVAAHYPAFERVVDLRAGSERTPWPPAIPVVTLDDIFRGAEPIEGQSLERIAIARRDIASRSMSFMSRSELRPFGWDDLCA